jgi:glutaminyl-tRNA synthetase
VQGVVNWVGQPAPGVEPATFEARLYDVLFTSESPGELEGDTWLDDLNPESLLVVQSALASPALARAQIGDRRGSPCISGG